MIEQYGHEAVYGTSGVQVQPDGTVVRFYTDGMPIRDFEVARMMGRARSSVERQRQKEAEARSKRSRR